MNNKSITLFIFYFFLFQHYLIAQLSVKTNQPNARYAVGDTAFFVIQSAVIALFLTPLNMILVHLYHLLERGKFN